MNAFTTVFFVTPPHYDPPGLEFLALIGPVPFIIGLILLFAWMKKSWSAAKAGSGERNYHDLLVTGILIVIGVCLTLAFTGSYFVQRNTASQFAHLYATQQYQVVEGPVHVLRLQPKGGHARGDLIEIGNKQFEIDYYLDTVGYRQTIANGGVLTEGTYARVYFVDDTIIRVEVKHPAESSNP
jgi:hypothetical protein